MTTSHRPGTHPQLILGREPALWLGVIAAAVQVISTAVFPLSTAQQGAVNAVAAAVLGAIGAFMVSAEKGVPALLGLLQAAIACGLAFGWHLDPGTQAAIMAAAATVSGLITRQLVVAPVPPKPIAVERKAVS